MKQTYGYFLIVVASVIWGSMGILGKLAFEYEIHPATLIALRILISSLTLLVPLVSLRRELFKIQKSHLVQFLTLGIFATALQRIAYFYAVDLTTATIAAILFYTYPIFVTAYSAFSLKEKVTFSTVFAIVLTFSGVALVVKAYEVSWVNASVSGIVSGILSSILFALYFIITKNLRKNYTNWTLIFYGDGIGAATLLPIVWYSCSEIASYPQQLWLLILSIAWVPSLLAYLLYSYALKHVEYSKGSILSVVEPLSAAVFSATILSENLEILQVVGVAFALAGVGTLLWKPNFRKSVAKQI